MTTPYRAIPLPFRIIDRYTTGPAGSWTRVEHPDGRRETLSPAEALGLLLLDPEAPADQVNAAISAWRRSEPRFGDGDDPDDLECGCNGFNSDRCPACDAELATDEIPF